MKKAADIFQVLRKRLLSDEFRSLHSISHSDFTRNRILTFQVTFALIFNLIRDSSAAEIDKFVDYFELRQFTKSSFSQARQKLSPNAFIDLNNALVSEYYSCNKINTFHGLILLAIDGFDVQLPISEPILDHFGYASNQTEKKMPMSLSSELYDVLNGITVDAIIAPYKSSERNIVFEHIKNLSVMQLKKHKFVIIFDRGYPSVLLICYLILMGIPFLMRSSTQFLNQVNDVIRNGKKDEIIEVCLKRLKNSERQQLLRLLPDIDFNLKIKFRVCIVKLSTGEVEILLTSLVDKKKYPRKIFCEFYFNRWGIETDIGFQKCRTEMENFCGESVIGVKQEFHATILHKNVASLLALESKQELENELEEKRELEKKQKTEESEPVLEVNHLIPKKTKHEYDINYSIAFAKIKNRFIATLLDPSSNLDDFCKIMKKSMKGNVEPIRPGRKFERRRHYPGKKFHKNLRRVA